jgi:hypothetical protein
MAIELAKPAVTLGGMPSFLSGRGAGGPAEVILDPTSEREPTELPLSPGLEGGATVALLDIRKPRGDVFLDELERLLGERGHRIERTQKPTFTKTAPPDVRAEIAERCDAVIEALAD